MILTVIKYIDARPQRMNERFAKLAYEALKAAWPCKGK
jgi:Rap1a immunity proteins